jgi:hypothetical protein
MWQIVSSTASARIPQKGYYFWGRPRLNQSDKKKSPIRNTKRELEKRTCNRLSDLAIRDDFRQSRSSPVIAHLTCIFSSCESLPSSVELLGREVAKFAVTSNGVVERFDVVEDVSASFVNGFCTGYIKEWGYSNPSGG